MNQVLLRFILFSFLMFLALETNIRAMKTALLETLIPAVVSIRTQETRRAFGNAQTIFGTGFLVDKEKGIIVTNRHIAAVNNPAAYEATWEDGSVTDLKLIWNDPVNDFAFLQVNINKIPSNAPQIHFSRKVKIGDDVVIIGNNEGVGHSVQTGKVNDLFTIVSLSWQHHALSLNLNTRGGSSGSPVFNKEGGAIGLNFAGNDTIASVVPIEYIDDALMDIRQGKIPERFSSGASFGTLNVDHAKDYFQYTNHEKTKSLLKGIPGARNRILVVNLILPGTQMLKVGDIIEKINDKFVGPSVYLLEKEINQSEGKPVKFTVWRNGEPMDLEVPVFNLNDSLCSKMVIFGGAVFASVDPLISYQTGMSIGSVCIGGKDRGSVFDQVFQISAEDPPFAQLKEMNGKPVNRLEDLLSLLPEIIEKKKFNYIVKDYSFIFQNNAYHTRQAELPCCAHYRPGQYPAPTMIEFNKAKTEWEHRSLD